MKIQSVTVFCGSKSGNQLGFTNQAIELGNALGENGIQLVYGGGGKGIMGAIADAVLAKYFKVSLYFALSKCQTINYECNHPFYIRNSLLFSVIRCSQNHRQE